MGRYRVGEHLPCFVIAEAGVNHNGDLDMARALVDVAVRAEANAVKFQSFKASKLATPCAPKAEYQLRTTDAEESQYQMLEHLELSQMAHRALVDYSRDKGILFMSSPFDEESADLLDDLGVDVFKIPSGEITNLPFLAHVARKKKPMIVSTGMSYLDEVNDAVKAIRNAGCKELILLHCVSSYPTDPSDANLRVMETMSKTFQVPVGFSDHTPGIEVSLAAVALGACVIEKHFTLDTTLPGPDQRISLDPHELQALISGIRKVEQALGTGAKEPAPSEANTRLVARRSIVAARDILEGSLLSSDMLTTLRPATGIAPTMADQLVGRRAKRSLKSGELIFWSDVE